MWKEILHINGLGRFKIIINKRKNNKLKENKGKENNKEKKINYKKKIINKKKNHFSCLKGSHIWCVLLLLLNLPVFMNIMKETVNWLFVLVTCCSCDQNVCHKIMGGFSNFSLFSEDLPHNYLVPCLWKHGRRGFLLMKNKKEENGNVEGVRTRYALRTSSG